MVQQNYQGEYEFQEPTLRQESTVRREKLSGESHGDREEFQPEKKQKMTQESIRTFWSIQGDFIYRHHIVPRVQLYVPRGESFPIPLKYIDVTRTTHTDLGVAQEKRTDDCWNVDANRNLSDSSTGFTRFTLLNETLPRGYVWSGERLTKIPNDIASKIAYGLALGQGPEKPHKEQEKQEWTVEKPKLEYARKLKGICSIDPSDEEYKDIIEKARQKL